MKRAVLAIRNSLVAEAVSHALQKAGMEVQKSSAQDAGRILTLCDALLAHLLVMDVTRTDEGTFDRRMDIAGKAKAQDAAIRVILLCDNVSDSEDAYRIKQAKEEGRIDAFFYESVPSDYLADAIDAL